MGFAKYYEVAKMNLSNSLAYFLDFLAGSVFIALIIFIFINLWKVVYADGATLIEGFTINMMVWYLIMTESIVTSPGSVINDIGNEVRSGDIATKLIKPYNYIGFKYATSLGKTLLRFVVTFVLGSFVAFVFLGGINFNVVNLPIILLTVFLALTLTYLMMALIGIFSFWLEDTRSLYFIYQKLVFVIGGMLVPLDIFPEWLRVISEKLPFSYVAYHPAKLFVKFNLGTALNVIFTQVIWIIIMILGIAFVYHKMTKRLCINGG